MYKTIFFLLSLFSSITAFSQDITQDTARLTLIDSQSEAYPLFTALDSTLLAPYHDVFRFGSFNMTKCIKFRQFLQPYVLKEDPKALYLYAKTFDLFEFWMGDMESAKIALKYYEKSAAQKYAKANFDLAGVYRFNFMNLGLVNKEKASNYLHQTILYGNEDIKVRAMTALVVSFKDSYPDSIPIYLEKVIQLDPRDTWSIDYLAGLYTDKGDYNKAADLLRQSDNINSQLRLAEWLIEGKNIGKDMNQGLDIIYKMYDKVAAMSNYMGSKDPVEILCKYYHCQKIITKEQLRGIDIGAAHCCY